jgi:hypothetical protein
VDVPGRQSIAALARELRPARTFRQLAMLVEQQASLESIRRSNVPQSFSCEGDISGISGSQYATTDAEAIRELLAKAAYAGDRRIASTSKLAAGDTSDRRWPSDSDATLGHRASQGFDLVGIPPPAREQCGRDRHEIERSRGAEPPEPSRLRVIVRRRCPGCAYVFRAYLRIASIAAPVIWVAVPARDTRA